MEKSLRIGIIGTGYVGLTTGACLARLGHDVICADVVPNKVDSLNAGQVPILEPGLDQLVESGLAKGNLSFVLGAPAAAADRDFVFLCLPTPEAADGSADLSYVFAAATEIGPYLAPQTVVINKSTVPVGTAAKVAQALGRSDVSVASNPEFLREGQAIQDFFHPDRIVIGADTSAIANQVAQIYVDIEAPLVTVDTATAELIKYSANAFLATKISFANSIASLCESVGANASQVLRGMGMDRRIGPQFLQPGPGWGGSCFPKDTLALVNIAAEAGFDFGLLRSVVESNDMHTDRLTARVARLLGGPVEGATIAAWGIAFKAGTDDTRQSPALKILDRLIQQGARVQAYDPGVKSVPAGIELYPDALSACADADLLIVCTEWPEFATVPARAVAAQLARPVVFDTRNVLDRAEYAAQGLAVEAVGHSTHHRLHAAHR